MKILGDADILVYTGAHSSQDYLKAVECVDFYLDRMRNKGEVSLYLSGKGNFRFDVAKTLPYKGNRKKDKPLQYKNLREYLIEHHGAVVVDGMEADDMLAILQDDNSMIATNDKDLKQVSGFLYDFKKDVVEYVDELEGLRNFLVQMLCGDTTDNIPGLPNPAKAHHKKQPCFTVESSRSLLTDKDARTMIKTVQDLYTDKDRYVEIGRLIFIRRKGFEDFEKYLETFLD